MQTLNNQTIHVQTTAIQDKTLQTISDNSNIIAVFGSRGSGKTALSYQILLNSVKERYAFQHPRTELLEPIGVKNCNSFTELTRLENAIVWFDEPQAILPNNSKNMNALNLLFTLARQRELTLVFSTVQTRYFTLQEEALIDTFIIKDIDYTLVKRGSPIRNAIKKHSLITPESFFLEKDEFIIHNRKFPELNRKFKFKLPKFWSERYSKPYADSLFGEGK